MYFLPRRAVVMSRPKESFKPPTFLEKALDGKTVFVCEQMDAATRSSISKIAQALHLTAWDMSTQAASLAESVRSQRALPQKLVLLGESVRDIFGLESDLGVPDFVAHVPVIWTHALSQDVASKRRIWQDIRAFVPS